MPYPDDFNSAAFDAEMRDRPEVAVRELTDDECLVIDRVCIVYVALMALRHAPWVSDLGTDADTHRDSLQADGTVYCVSLIAAICAQPRDEAAAEERRIIEAQWEAGR